MNKKDSLGDRMKNNYESRCSHKLIRRMPVILRLDGKAFHTFTKDSRKPFDENFINAISHTAAILCNDIQGAKFAYVQSDEISILLTDFDKLNTEAWFDYKIQKMVSIASAIASVQFNGLYKNRSFTPGVFDCRAFNIPISEVTNYFVWRQKDWIRNSVQMLAQSHFSHKQLHKKSQADIHEMLYNLDTPVNWAKLSDHLKNGRCVYKAGRGWSSVPAPIFTENKNLIEDLLTPSEE